MPGVSARPATFFLSSTTVSAVEMTETIGLEPDSVSVRGSRNQDWPSPRNHIWSIQDDTSERCVEDQIVAVVERLRPYHSGLKRLAAHEDIGAQLSITRELGAATPREEIGWWIDEEPLAFLTSIGANLNCTEYVLVPTLTQAVTALPSRCHESLQIFLYRFRRRRRQRVNH